MSEQMAWSANGTKPIKELIEKLDDGSAQLMMVDVTKHGIKPAL
jgi:hypothetical protein